MNALQIRYNQTKLNRIGEGMERANALESRERKTELGFL